MPLIPHMFSPILIHKFFGNLGMAQFELASMVIVKMWLLIVDMQEPERMKCRDPKSNDLIFGSNKNVIFWPIWGLLHLKRLMLSATILHVANLPDTRHNHDSCDVLAVISSLIFVMSRGVVYLGDTK